MSSSRRGTTSIIGDTAVFSDIQAIITALSKVEENFDRLRPNTVAMAPVMIQRITIILENVNEKIKKHLNEGLPRLLQDNAMLKYERSRHEQLETFLNAMEECEKALDDCLTQFQAAEKIAVYLQTFEEGVGSSSESGQNYQGQAEADYQFWKKLNQFVEHIVETMESKRAATIAKNLQQEW